MKYRLTQDGRDVGEFALDELRRRRDAGELTGNEWVWCEGMTDWKPLNTVLQTVPPKFIAPPPLPPGQRRDNGAKIALVVVGFLVLGATVFGVFGYRVVKQMTSVIKSAQSAGTIGSPDNSSGMGAASRPAVWTTNSLSWRDVREQRREFRVRQYIEGYQLRGDRNPECDLLAQQFLTNWIAYHYGGTMDTNLPSLDDLSDRLANDPACEDPLILTVAGENAVEAHESVRRLERAVKGFENSKHLAYPKLYAVVTLATRLINERQSRVPLLDAQALAYLKDAFADGSIRPEDQAELGDIFTENWGTDFFDRNSVAVYTLVQGEGKDFRWLALTLEGQKEIAAAWRARGGGFADTVTDAGSRGFNDHLAKARSCLTEAWSLRPDLPLAPARMIYVSLGDSGIDEMRKWFDRTTTAQLDYAHAWSDMRWGLRPRWYGDYDSMLAFGRTALKTHRFDTDVPRVDFDSLSDVESEMELPQGQHLYAREDVWRDLQELYEGYIAEPSLNANDRDGWRAATHHDAHQPSNPSLNAYDRDGWRSTYAVVASLAGHWEVARKQMEALNWQPHDSNLTGWGRDMTLLPQEVAARTGSESAMVMTAESLHDSGQIVKARQSYKGIMDAPNVDKLTRWFAWDRVASLTLEDHFQAGGWADFMPVDTNFAGWHVNFGDFKLRKDGSLEVTSGSYGHMIYARARMSPDFEVRGEFEVVSNNTGAFQAGLVMGVPQWETYNWYAFRMKRTKDEGDVASFSSHWSQREIKSPVTLDGRVNTFDFTMHNGRINATVDGQQVFQNAEPPKYASVTTNEFLLGLGAFNNTDTTMIRYRNIVVQRLSPSGTSTGN